MVQIACAGSDLELGKVTTQLVDRAGFGFGGLEMGVEKFASLRGERIGHPDDLGQTGEVGARDTLGSDGVVVEIGVGNPTGLGALQHQGAQAEGLKPPHHLEAPRARFHQDEISGAKVLFRPRFHFGDGKVLVPGDHPCLAGAASGKQRDGEDIGVEIKADDAPSWRGCRSEVVSESVFAFAHGWVMELVCGATPWRGRASVAAGAKGDIQASGVPRPQRRCLSRQRAHSRKRALSPVYSSSLDCLPATHGCCRHLQVLKHRLYHFCSLKLRHGAPRPTSCHHGITEDRDRCRRHQNTRETRKEARIGFRFSRGFWLL